MIMVPTRETHIVTPVQWMKSRGASTGTDRCGAFGVDFETYYSADYSVSKMGTKAYSRDPRFDAYLVAVSSGSATCVCPPADFPWGTIDGQEWVSHNRDFDRSVWERLVDLGTICSEGPSVWQCSAALSAYLQYPRNLAGAMATVFGIEVDKSMRTENRGRQFTQGELAGLENQALLRYAAVDAEACLALWDKLQAEWPAHERRLFELTSEMGRRGVHMDWRYIEKKKRELIELIGSLSAALPWASPLSTQRFRMACEGEGVPPPKSTCATAPRFIHWLAKYIDTKPALWARHMQRIRSANRTAKLLSSMESRRVGDDPSARMAYELKYFGASTGRWSGGGGLNLQNLPRVAAEGVDIRRTIVAPPGYLLAAVDYAQIESRILLFLAGDRKALAMFAENPDADAYEIHARATMGYSEPEPLRDYCARMGANLRQVAKARVLGLGFGCGWKKFIEVAKTMAGLDLGEEESRYIVNSFRDANPRIVKLWRRLNDACAACDGRDYVLPLPCTQANPSLKRYLIYRDVVAGENGLEGTVCGRRTKVYGGLLAENWTQATARDVLASAWLRCADAGYVPVLSVHDELVFEVPRQSAQEDLLGIIRIMEQPISWAPGLSLKAEGELMEHYRK